MNDENWMQAAILEARQGIENGEGGPFGTVIVKDGKIVGRGHNCVLLKKDPTCHGEMEAIRDACKNLGTHDLSGCVLFTTSEPCPMCLGGILWANIREIVSGCTIQDAENIGFRDTVFYDILNGKSEGKLIRRSLLRGDCLKLFDDYQKSTKTRY
ncbi:MAG: nucleoside deaminase [Hallerella porci]|uniref:tRNA(Arg) A34 adenosine deaminase TadA n=1 Tax=Hallerella porci TaxID=1945871 RepID=A0ABX5LJ14_9BACT|nr:MULTISPECIES: nucleoside deaminase [Hallerella]MCI5600098.1 nucleoside deaminase [Hallerella sp.]MDY3920808.1 nucleoside deaminase [Hallerella porci]PWK93186.1 tRNA(Arg) A34 adenosine deaminase TadA [Hallerella porci]